jgi:glucose/mannose-6-phosphate isomerase
MYSVYDKWPEIAKESFQLELNKIEFPGINHIVFAGMGGSGTIGTVFSSILSKSNIHVSIVNGYILPKTVDKDTLVVTTSISGNTVETLTVLNSTKLLGCKVLACSSGGKIEDYCIKNEIEFRKIPMIHSPRASFVSFLYAMLKVLSPIIPIQIHDINESINELEKTREYIFSENLSSNNTAFELANKISGIPLIYYPAGLQAAAIRFKSSLQENTKMHALAEDVIEACHNGIVAWDYPSQIIPILIEGEDDYIKTKERWMILKEFFDSKNIEYLEIFSGNGNILTKLARLIYILDYSTIYKAAMLKIDPSPIDPIDYIKKKLLS